ncbi:MAG: GntR family transcriptional regulator [Frankiales bacterium]|nr:GntR family transcriptional regulator [Frankiales bacterium]
MTFAVPPTRAAAVLAQLREEIVCGAMSAGTPVKDAELAARLGVSITPVREAIAQLAVEGLIDIAPNRTRRVTRVTQKNALELIDIMELLACAGVEWGIDRLTDEHLAALGRELVQFSDAVKRGDVAAASSSGAQFSTVLISACGNQELQKHIDLVVARTLRVLAIGADINLWRIWLDGYRELLACLEVGDRPGAARRHREIYRQYRAQVGTLLAESPSDGADPGSRA